MFGHQTQSEWFFDSSVHLEAVSRLLYLVESHEPLGLVQGPDGSGRSRVLGRLREELSRTGIMTVPLPLSGMDEESALWQLAEGLCARLRPSMRRHELLSLVRDELSGRGRCGVQTVILLDDFHRAAEDEPFTRGATSVGAFALRQLHPTQFQPITGLNRIHSTKSISFTPLLARTVMPTL